MPTRQIVLTSSLGLIMCGLAVAALFTQLILSAGRESSDAVSFSALTYVVLGYLGLRIGNHRYRSGKHLPSPAPPQASHGRG